MRARKTTGICFECCAEVQGRAKYCDPCYLKRANELKRGAYFCEAKQTLEDLQDMDAPLRTDKVVDLAIRVAV